MVSKVYYVPTSIYHSECQLPALYICTNFVAGWIFVFTSAFEWLLHDIHYSCDNDRGFVCLALGSVTSSLRTPRNPQGTSTMGSTLGWVIKQGGNDIHVRWNYFWITVQNGDVAQLVEQWTDTPLMQFRFSGAARDFSPRVSIRCRLSYGVRTPPVCNRMHLPGVPIRVHSIMKTLKTPSMHPRLSSVTVAAGFPWGRQPEFPMGEIPLGQKAVKCKSKRKESGLNGEQVCKKWFVNTYYMKKQRDRFCCYCFVFVVLFSVSLLLK